MDLTFTTAECIFKVKCVSVSTFDILTCNYVMLMFQPSLTSHTRSVVHDVPVGVIPERNWEDYEEPAMPDFDVRTDSILASPYLFVANLFW